MNTTHLKKSWKQTLWKTINVVSSITLIVNMTMVGVFIAPQAASAHVTQPNLQVAKYAWDETTDTWKNWYPNPNQDYVQAQPGETITFMIKVWNTGTGTGTTNITDDLYDGTDNIWQTLPTRPDINGVSLLGGAVSEPGFTVGGNKNGTTNFYVYTYTGTLKASYATSGTYYSINKARLSQNGAVSKAKVAVTFSCNLTLTKSVDNLTHPQGPNMPNDVLKYTIIYKNEGSANCTGGGVLLYDYMEGAITYSGNQQIVVAPQQTGGEIPQYNTLFNGKNGQYMYNLKTVSPGENGVVTFNATIDPNNQCGDLPDVKNKAKTDGNESGSDKITPWVITDVTGPACTGNLTVNKYFDDNGDGQIDRTNPQGWTWDITNGDQNIPGGTTKALIPATHEITEDAIIDYSSTWTCSDQTNGQGTHFNVVVPSQGNIICSFTNTRDTGDLLIKKFNDLNGNGQWDPSPVEPLLPGWHFVVTDHSTHAVVASGDTDGTGKLLISDLPTGSYDVTETLQNGWINTTPLTQLVHVVVSENPMLVAFGNFQKISISGMKFYDHNANGVKDAGDEGLINWTIFIDANGNGILDNGEISALTDANGNYTFTDLGPGTYKVREVQKNGWTQSTANPADIIASSGTNVDNIDFGNYQLGEIDVCKYNDLNGDGQKGENEPFLSGWNIILSQNDQDITSQLTHEDGCTTFTGLTYGIYQVREDIQTGWTQTQPGNNTYTIEVSSPRVQVVKFGNFQNGAISGHKFNDLNGNGVWDENEPAIAEWKIMLDNGAFTYTDANGYYEFNTLTAGTYVVSEEHPAGWLQTKPTNPNTYSVLVSSGTNSQNNDFGNYGYGRITGYKYEDTNGNGSYDAGIDQPIAGWTINLSNGQTTHTALNGYYEFTGLTAGDYTVSESYNSNIWWPFFPTSYHFTVTSGYDHQFDFLNFKFGKISGHKYQDTNGNGHRDQNEPTLHGWTIKLWNGQTLVDTAVTDSHGNYEFSHLMPGTYTITEVQQNNWIQTYGPSDVTITSGTDSQNNNFGNFKLGKISGYKYEDKDGDGNLGDTGNTKLDGWTICLDANTCVVTGTGSWPLGYYEFTNLPAGTYTLTEQVKPGWTQTKSPNPVTVQSDTNSQNNNFGNFEHVTITACKIVDADGNLDTHGDQTNKPGWTVYLWKNSQIIDTRVTGDNGCYTWTNLGAGSYKVSEATPEGWQALNNTSENFGSLDSGDSVSYTFKNFQKASITVTKLLDADGNGNTTNDQAPAQNWKVQLWQGNNKIGSDHFTGADGTYTWTNLGPGTYTVKEVFDTDYYQALSATSYNVTVHSGQNSSVTFINWQLPPLQIVATKIVCDNESDLPNWGNGGPHITAATASSFLAQHPNCHLESGWQFQWGDSSATNPGDTFIGLSGNNKWHTFGPTDANGTTTVSIDTLQDKFWMREGLKDGYIPFTYGPNGNHNTDNKSAELYCNTDVVNYDNYDFIDNPQMNHTYYCVAWNVQNIGNITGTKFNDLNGNGTRDQGEPGVGEVTINLSNGLTTQTAADGSYSFTDVPVGTYTVSEIVPTGWTATTPTSYDNVQIVLDQTTPVSDFGNFQNTSITGMKFNDLDGNGQMDEEEDGLANWTIKLYKWDDEEEEYIFDKQTATDSEGDYSFTDLGPGTYKVEEVQQTPDWTQTYPNDPNYYDDIVLQSGTPVTDKDFGNFEVPTLTVIKQVINDNGGTAVANDFTDDIVITANNASTPSYSGNDTEVSATITVSAGDYNVVENAITGYSTSYSGDCSGTMQSGDEKTCTITNDDQAPHLTLLKEVVNDNGGTALASDWTLTATGPTTISGQTPVVSGTDFKAGTYILSESGPTGYAASAWDCDNKETPQLQATDNQITLALGQSATCKITNDDIQPTLTIDKWNNEEVAHGGDGIAQANETIQYRIDWSVSNDSVKASNVVITDELPTELILDAASINSSIPAISMTSDTTATGTTVITWVLGDQQPGASGYVTYTATVEASIANGTPITNIAKISADNTDPKFKEDDSTITVNSAPILEITKSVTPKETVAGSQVTYTVVIKNTGTDTAINVQLTDLLPAGFTFTDYGTASHTFSLGDLAAGAQTTVTYKVTIGAGVIPGKYDNLATASADNYGNVTAHATVTIGAIKGVEALPKLVITKTVDKKFINPGGSATYTVTITNKGDAPAINVKLQDVLPAGFTFTNKDITKTWSLGNLAVGKSIKVSYKVLSDKTILPGKYKNLAVTWADNNGKISATKQLEVRKIQVLGAETLPETGTSPLDYLYFFGAGVVLIFTLYVLKLTFSRDE